MINESHAVCAGYYNASETSYNYTGIYYGDSGSSLIIRDIETQKSTMIGVAVDIPGVKYYAIEPHFQYANVAILIPWVLKTIKKGKQRISL